MSFGVNSEGFYIEVNAAPTAVAEGCFAIAEDFANSSPPVFENNPHRDSGGPIYPN